MHSRGTCNQCGETRWLTGGVCPECGRRLRAAREQEASNMRIKREEETQAKILQQFVGELESVDDEAIWWELGFRGD